MPPKVVTSTPVIDPNAVRVRAPDGTIGTVAPADLDQARAAGASILTPEEIRQEDLQAKYGDALGITTAGAAGALRGATLGLSDVAFAKLGGKEYADVLRDLKEANPGTSTASEIAGAVVPALVSEGGSLATTVRSIGAPTRGLARLGALAEGGVAKVVGTEAKTLGGRALQRAAQVGAQGFVEGAGQGLAAQLSEDMLEGHDLHAQALAAAAGRGALLGGVFGGVLGGGGALALGGIGKLAGRLNETIEGTLGKQAAKSGATIDDVGEAYFRRAENEEIREAQRRVYDAQKTLGQVDDSLDRTARHLTERGNVAMHVDDVVLPKIAFGDGKAAQMAQLVKAKDPERALKSALQMRAEVEATVNWLEELGESRGGSPAAWKRVRESVDNFDHKWKAIHGVHPDDAARDAFLYGDELKRAVGRQAGMGMNPRMRTETQREFFDLYERLRTPLEDVEVWGPAGLAQKEVNKATTDKLSLSGRLKEAFLTSDTKIGGDAITKFDPGDLKSYLRNIRGAEADNRREALAAWTGGQRNLMQAVEKHYALTKAQRAEFKEAYKALDDFEVALTEAEKEAHAVASTTALRDAEQARAIGGLTGLAIDAFTSPITTAARLGQLRRAADQVQTSNVLANIAKVTERIRGSIEAAIKGFFNSETLSTAATVGVLYSKRPKREESEEQIRRVKELASNPDMMANTVAQYTGRTLAGAAPKITAAAMANTTAGLGYLNSIAPKGIGARGMPLLRSDLKRRYTDAELAKWDRAYQAWANPLSVLKGVERGHISREGAEVLRRTQPELFREMQKGVQHQLQILERKGGKLSFDKRNRLSILLGIPTSDVHEQGVMAAIQGSFGPPANDQSQPPQGPARPVKSDYSASRTLTERLSA